MKDYIRKIKNRPFGRFLGDLWDPPRGITRPALTPDYHCMYLQKMSKSYLIIF
jgi:hypothetical protein